MPVMIHTQTKSQIRGTTFAAVGAFYGFTAGENTLTFRVKISNQRNYIRITLNGSDLYDVEQLQVRAGKTTVKFVANDIYADQLDEVVYRLGSTRHASKEWLAECGIKAAA